MTGRWSFTVDCPRCGGTLTPQAHSRTHPHTNLESRAVAQCDHCHDTYILTLTLTSERNRRTAEHSLRNIGCAPSDPPQRHGTFVA